MRSFKSWKAEVSGMIAGRQGWLAARIVRSNADADYAAKAISRQCLNAADRWATKVEKLSLLTLDNEKAWK